MNANQVLWEKGDFTRIAETMRQSGEQLVHRIGIKKGMKVLDVGCGDGTTAIPAARLGADVLGVDIARNLVTAGNRRAQAEKLSNCRFVEGDACNLQAIADGEFDVTMSIFGAMFAPKPFEVARELVRVTKNGGKVIMGNWIPNDPTLVAQILRISSAYTPPPPEGFISPMTWGIPDNVAQRFGEAGVQPQQITYTRETFTFDVPIAPPVFMNLFKMFYGPTMNAFEAAEKNGRDRELADELKTLFVSQNKSGRDDATTIDATFLLVSVGV